MLLESIGLKWLSCASPRLGANGCLCIHFRCCDWLRYPVSPLWDQCRDDLVNLHLEGSLGLFCVVWTMVIQQTKDDLLNQNIYVRHSTR